ncbi:Uncharacterised protein [Yersinia similis]|nr:Uncharacterised protein [Yersinia similis]
MDSDNIFSIPIYVGCREIKRIDVNHYIIYHYKSIMNCNLFSVARDRL